LRRRNADVLLRLGGRCNARRADEIQLSPLARAPAVRTRTTLIFDLDGTLSDNFSGIANCILHAFERLGRAAPPRASLASCVGPPLRASFGTLLATHDSGEIERAIGYYRERYAAIGWQENVLYEAIPHTLGELHRHGCPMYVCTSKPQVYAER